MDDDEKKANAKESVEPTVHSFKIDVAFGLPRESANKLAATLYEDIMDDVSAVIAKKVKSIVEGIEDAIRKCGAK